MRFIQFSSDIQSYSTLHDPIDHSTTGPCPSPTPRIYSNSSPLSQWCHPTVSSSAVPFSSCLQSFPASGFSPVGWLFTSGGQSIGALASVLPMNIQGWFPLGLTGLISLLSKGLSSLLQHHSSKASILQHSTFFMVQLSHCTWLPEKPYLWLYGPLLAKWCLCFWVCYLGWS